MQAKIQRETTLQIPFPIPVPLTSRNDCTLADFTAIRLCVKVITTKPFIPPGVPSRGGSRKLHVLGFVQAMSKVPYNFIIIRKRSTRTGNIFCHTKCTPKLGGGGGGPGATMLYHKYIRLSNGFNLLIPLVPRLTLKPTVHIWTSTDLTTSTSTRDEKRYTNRPQAS
jgi:hypothetical protein